jgi:hypothetical protein
MRTRYFGCSPPSLRHYCSGRGACLGIRLAPDVPNAIGNYSGSLFAPRYDRNMTKDELQCPKCQGEMVQGFVPDHSQSAVLVGRWQTGQPKKSFWTRTKAPLDEGVPIGAFRCQKCGFLEFYADPIFAAQ